MDDLFLPLIITFGLGCLCGVLVGCSLKQEIKYVILDKSQVIESLGK